MEKELGVILGMVKWSLTDVSLTLIWLVFLRSFVWLDNGMQQDLRVKV